MKILFIAAIVPYPPRDGGQLRIFGLLRELAKTHEVTFLSFARPEEFDHAAPLMALGLKAVRFIPAPQWTPKARGYNLFQRKPFAVRANESAAFAEVVEELLAGGDLDIIHISEAVMAACFLGRQASVPMILDRQKIDSWFFKQLLEIKPQEKTFIQRAKGWTELLKWRDYETRLAATIPSQIVLTVEDAALLHEIDEEIQTAVIGNGVDIDYFAFNPIDEESGPVITFIGSMDYQPNIEGIHYYTTEIHPLIRSACPELQVWIVGRDPVPGIQALDGREGIHVTGRVADVRPYLARGALTIVPIRVGGGMRNKVLESMAAGRPVVSTKTGAEGLACVAGRDFLLAEDDDPAAFASHVLTLLAKPGLRKELAANGRRLVEEQYTWPRVVEHLEAAYKKAIAAVKS